MSQTFTKKTQSTIRDSFRQMQKRLGNKMINEITLEDCQRFILKCDQPGGCPNARQQIHTARKHYQHLRSAFSWAIQAGLLQENHFTKFKRPKAPESELDYFSEEDFGTLYNGMSTATYAERRLRNLVVIAYETGMRLAELRFLQLDSLDLQNRRVKITVTDLFVPKNKKGRVVPLSDNVMSNEWFTVYQEELEIIWIELTQINCGLLILGRIAQFPFHILGKFGRRTPLEDVSFYSVFKSVTLALWKITQDTDPKSPSRQ